MNPEIKGKFVVALIVSLIAFGFGTGASMFTDFKFYTPNSSNYTIKQPSDLPVVYNVKNNTQTNTTPTNTQPSTDTSSNTQDVYNEPSTNNPTNPQTGGNQSSNNSQTKP